MFSFQVPDRNSRFTKRSGLSSLKEWTPQYDDIQKQEDNYRQYIIGQNTETAYKIILFQSLHKSSSERT